MLIDGNVAWLIPSLIYGMAQESGGHRGLVSINDF